MGAAGTEGERLGEHGQATTGGELPAVLAALGRSTLRSLLGGIHVQCMWLQLIRTSATTLTMPASAKQNKRGGGGGVEAIMAHHPQR